MKQFIVIITIISATVALIGWLVFSKFIPQYYIPIFPFLLIFFAVASVLVHAYQLHLAKKDMGKFTRSNMIITFLKLFLYSAFAVIYIAVDTKNAKVFVICFALLYIIYTVSEVLSLTGIGKSSNTKK